MYYKASLSPPRKKLIELMQELNFGRINHLVIREGEPIFQPAPTVIREYKFGAENGTRQERMKKDFFLKSQVAELMQQLETIQDGTIIELEVKHGLPFRMSLVEEFATRRKEGSSDGCIS